MQAPTIYKQYSNYINLAETTEPPAKWFQGV